MSTAKSLRPDPDIPLELKEAALDGKLVLFVGAGASMLLGMPSWDDLAKEALEDVRNFGEINFSEKELLLKLPPKQQLSIAKILAKKGGHKLDLSKNLVSSQKSDVYETLNSIGATCVTTNYDHSLIPSTKVRASVSQSPSVTRVSGVENLKAADLRIPGTVIHLHGEKDDPEDMIVDTKQYLAHYDNQRVAHFLKELFNDYVVLFIGYGLAEAEILEHILRRSGVELDSNERRRFTLQGFFDSEQSLYENLVKYYEYSYGVHLIGFSKDLRGYRQLERILKDWARELDVRSITATDEFAEIDEVIPIEY